MNLDALIFGGGVAGLWLLDELCRGGYRAMLVERDSFGAGQTIASQGIIHGGMKYAITGSQRASAEAIRDMPDLWRDCLAGHRRPNLRAVRLRSPHCYMWRTTSLASTLGMIGARAGLRSHAGKVAPSDRPEPLRNCPGDVFMLDEQVLNVATLMEALSRPNIERCIAIDAATGVSFDSSGAGGVNAVMFKRDDESAQLTIRPRFVVFTAGAGNAELRERVGLPPQAMQRRPLHMAMTRGRLPELYGHCIDGAKTRVTVTSATDSAGRTVWQIGGQVSEDGVNMDEGALIVHARRELIDVLPGVSLAESEWSTYRIDRAEGRTPDGGRPADVQIVAEGNVITVWPTKLALAPRAAMLVAERLGPPATAGHAEGEGGSAGWPTPRIAPPPWETPRRWVTL